MQASPPVQVVGVGLLESPLDHGGWGCWHLHLIGFWGGDVGLDIVV